MRILHARYDDDRVRDAQAYAKPIRTRNPRRNLREPLPLHRLQQHRQSNCPGCKRATGTGALMTASIGVSMKRKEDPRFIRGKGRYLDDIVLPNMLYLALVHSPYPHARIKSIDKTAAMAVPGVKAVITGEDLNAANLEWLPTFHGFDKQMVLAFGKTLYQYQEVAGVIAETRE